TTAQTSTPRPTCACTVRKFCRKVLSDTSAQVGRVAWRTSFLVEVLGTGSDYSGPPISRHVTCVLLSDYPPESVKLIVIWVSTHGRKNKKTASKRGLRKLSCSCWCRYFGGSAGFAAGAAGLDAAPPGRALLVGREADGAAGTPDCELYNSTIGRVMSTDWPAQSTGPSGHGLETSMIRLSPFSFAYLSITGPIFCRIFC